MMPDIDIDFVDRTEALKLFDHIKASRNDNGIPVAHNTGVYLHAVPVHAPSNLCAVAYDQADEFNFFKIDLVNKIHLLYLLYYLIKKNRFL